MVTPHLYLTRGETVHSIKTEWNLSHYPSGETRVVVVTPPNPNQEEGGGEQTTKTKHNTFALTRSSFPPPSEEMSMDLNYLNASIRDSRFSFVSVEKTEGKPLPFPPRFRFFHWSSTAVRPLLSFLFDADDGVEDDIPLSSLPDLYPDEERLVDASKVAYLSLFLDPVIRYHFPLAFPSSAPQVWSVLAASFERAIFIFPDGYTFGKEDPEVALHFVVLDDDESWNADPNLMMSVLLPKDEDALYRHIAFGKDKPKQKKQMSLPLCVEGRQSMRVDVRWLTRKIVPFGSSSRDNFFDTLGSSEDEEGFKTLSDVDVSEVVSTYDTMTPTASPPSTPGGMDQ